MKVWLLIPFSLLLGVIFWVLEQYVSPKTKVEKNTRNPKISSLIGNGNPKIAIYCLNQAILWYLVTVVTGSILYQNIQFSQMFSITVTGMGPINYFFLQLRNMDHSKLLGQKLVKRHIFTEFSCIYWLKCHLKIKCNWK